MVGVVADKTTKLHELCRRYKVQRLEVFGSAVRGDFNADTSDLDFLVEFLPMSPEEHGDCHWALLEAFDRLFGRHIGLVETPAIRNPYFLRVIARTRTVLYPDGPLLRQGVDALLATPEEEEAEPESSGE